MFNDVVFNFKDKIVLVTGGSRGIGKACAVALVSYGAKVIYTSRNPMEQESRCIFFRVDLSDEAQIKNLFKYIDNIGPIDIFINSAAINFAKKCEQITLQEWNSVLSVNLSAAFLMSQEAILRMKKKRYGKIVHVSSIAGRHRSLISGVHYVASKAGLIGLTRQLAYEVAPFNINVNAVCPSQTFTDMLLKTMPIESIKVLEKVIPLGRIAEVKEQVGPILFLCSEAAAYITGSVIDVNGGQL